MDGDEFKLTGENEKNEMNDKNMERMFKSLQAAVDGLKAIQKCVEDDLPSKEMRRICTCDAYVHYSGEIARFSNKISKLDMEDIVGAENWKDIKTALKDVDNAFCTSFARITSFYDDMDVWKKEKGKGEEQE